MKLNYSLFSFVFVYGCLVYGQVGIGNEDPGATLEVTGDVLVHFTWKIPVLIRELLIQNC